MPTLPSLLIVIRSAREAPFVGPVKNPILCGAVPTLTAPSTTNEINAVACVADPSKTAPKNESTSSPDEAARGEVRVPRERTPLNTARCAALPDDAETIENPGAVALALISAKSVDNKADAGNVPLVM
jgi:hypothetical protein